MVTTTQSSSLTMSWTWSRIWTTTCRTSSAMPSGGQTGLLVCIGFLIQNQMVFFSASLMSCKGQCAQSITSSPRGWPNWSPDTYPYSRPKADDVLLSITGLSSAGLCAQSIIHSPLCTFHFWRNRLNMATGLSVCTS